MGEWRRWSPVDVERHLRDCLNTLTRKMVDLEQLEKDASDAEVEYKVGLAKAQLTSDRKSVEDRKADAMVKCERLYREAMVKGAVRDACRESVRAQRDILGAIQSVGALVRAESELAR